MIENKINIALVYSPQTGPPAQIYENDTAVIHAYAKPNPDMINVGMGFYSIPNPTEQDYLLAIEPYCVLERDYDPTYVGMYKKIFTWTSEAYRSPHFQNKIVEINHPSCKTILDPDLMTQQWTPWNERRNEIVFIANNKMSNHESELYTFRLQLADRLHQKSKFKVSWYGQIPISRPYYAGRLESKDDILKKVKFSVCTENCWHPIYSKNYFTEKMPEVWMAGAVPIYWGCYNVDSFGFAEHSYIDLRTYVRRSSRDIHDIDINSLLGRIENFDEIRYENFKEDVRYNIKKPDGLYHLISYDRMYETIANTITQSIRS